MGILIRNGNIFTATDNFIGDVYIEGETVVAVGQNLPYTADRVIDATGKFVFPGGIDPHVHLDMPFMGTYSSDNYETGTRAALHGGTTMVIDFVLQTQGNPPKCPRRMAGPFQWQCFWRLQFPHGGDGFQR